MLDQTIEMTALIRFLERAALARVALSPAQAVWLVLLASELRMGRLS